MKRESLPDGGHDKVISKRNRDRSRDKASRQCNSDTWWRRTTVTLLGVSFGSYRRCPRYVLMGRRGYVPLRRLGDVPLRQRWVFHLRHTCDVARTYRVASLRRLVAGWVSNNDTTMSPKNLDNISNFEG